MTSTMPSTSASTSSTDFLMIYRHYIERALREIKGMKMLLVDAETVRYFSVVFSQSDILAAEVYLVDRIDAVERTVSRHARETNHAEKSMSEKLTYLKAFVFLRPTRENVARLRKELRSPRFGEYHLYFTNRIDNMKLQDLADADEEERVATVQEVYGDFIPLEGHHAVVPLPRPYLALTRASWNCAGSSDMISQMTEGIASMMMALRRKFTIRYQHGSGMSTKLAKSLHYLINSEQRELFDFGSRAGEAAPLLLILDRRDDPVTPLLTQWTYQAMIHDILGIYDNRCSLQHVVGLRPELTEAVLSPTQDNFFKENMYSNFGDVGMAVKELVDIVGKDSLRGKEFQSIDDMASFVEALPDMTAQQGLTAKHVTLMSEMSHIVDRRQLMEVSSVEQDIVCQSTAPDRHFEAVSNLIKSAAIRPFDKAKLVTLYALRYEGTGQASALISELGDHGVQPNIIAAIKCLIRSCKSEDRVMDIFSDRTFSSRMASLAKKHLKGVENVYTQHSPPLLNLLENAAKCRLGSEFPESDGTVADGPSQFAVRPPKLIVAFIIGGTTYEESKAVAELNAGSCKGDGWSSGIRFLLTGTGVQNANLFLSDWEQVALEERYAAQSGSGHARARAGAEYY